MAASGDITVAQDGGNVKLHPYLVTLVRWCVSCLWSTATVLLHRLMIMPLQPITGIKPLVKPVIPKRAAGTEHLHPEPKVECQLLHQPANHTLDVIFVHGLYGSLGNTWRQGDWRPKYRDDPQKVPLRNHSKPITCTCRETTHKNGVYEQTKCDDSVTDLNDPEMSLKRINEKLSKKVIPTENDLITEQFYNNTLKDQVEIDNYDTQAKFVSDLFKKEIDCDNCDESEKNNKTNDKNGTNNDFKCKYNEVNEFNECKCKEKQCEVGCGCICNECYSSCWPKDWIKVDYPGARIISINYTSDPYLWRPLWIKENKRLNLYQRAEQMIEQLLEMSVGEKPIIWVGHSKGGLFIKQIYCEAYEAYLKTNKTEVQRTKININTEEDNTEPRNGITAENIDTIIGHFRHNAEDKKDQNYSNYTSDCDNHINNGYKAGYDNSSKSYRNNDDNIENDVHHKNENNYIDYDDNYNKNSIFANRNYDANRNTYVLTEINKYSNIFEENNAKNDSANNLESINIIKDDCNLFGIELEAFLNDNKEKRNGIDSTSSIEATLVSRASLWSSSRGFMFYSVPHRGSPLADIKTPVTARSVDLLEIAKDCPLVLELQSRWLTAHSDTRARVAVRSFVETCRTLMSLLWLRIVSTESADAGIGVLTGISVDHREICKPSSRRCLLYTELTDLIHEALKCKCQ